MNKWIAIFFVFVILICVSLGFYFLQSQRKAIDFSAVKNRVQSNCKEITPPFNSIDQEYIYYVQKLTLALGNDSVVYDAQSKTFLSSSNKHFIVQRLPDTSCWLVMVEEKQGEGRLVYETEKGFVVLKINNFNLAGVH